ncbi:MAG: urea ABC transporter permease subunit UrtB [Rhodospirillaceae bacterium]|jgi:urea transport system permease protein|nr:urea ABC transporter permease subunit UrtB [Rhodospirillaceae bacterium]MBT7447769.1 urea ABC transporter permease subunit UrtB [Tateyamaria sp.]MDC0541432.1 urea ABC transporter permease subunit UrtB [Paracoccaceae bacterium]
MFGYTFGELGSIFAMQGFAGLILFSVFLLMGLGLAIIFGQLGVINMAHGEFMMIGMYITYIMQLLFLHFLPDLMGIYFFFAMAVAFIFTAILGGCVEWLIIRHLYRRPLDTLLATWGISLILQQSIRVVFGTREVGVVKPDWMMGSISLTDMIDIQIYGLVVMVITIILTIFVMFAMLRSLWGKHVRAVVQNREMAGAVGINTARTDRMTFAIGCGIAGIAGSAFTMISSTAPDAGQHYIVDTFLVVVFGGAGSLLGTVVSAFTISQLQSTLEFFITGSMAKVWTLLVVIGILMVRPQGLFALKIRR